jgi:hypothetical protein
MSAKTLVEIFSKQSKHNKIACLELLNQLQTQAIVAAFEVERGTFQMDPRSAMMSSSENFRSS